MSTSKKAPNTPYLTALVNTLHLFAFKTLLYITSFFHNSPSPPTLTKKLDPSLKPARIFFPPNTHKGSPPLPTLFSLHGGGFCLGSPIDDDHINARLAQTGILTIALPYPLAPRSPFPIALASIASQIRKAISDLDLPIDVSRLGLIGFSAGGNLALAVQQVDGLPRFKTTVAFYPAVDLVPSKEEKLARRAPTARSEDDMLFPLVPLFEYAYIPAGTFLDDPGLSPRYAARKALTEWLFVVGCERDMLCHEAGEAVARWLGREWDEGGKDEMVGEGGKFRWLRVNGQKHAYTHDIPPIVRNESEEERKERKRKDEEVWEVVSSWLMNGPFKK